MDNISSLQRVQRVRGEFQPTPDLNNALDEFAVPDDNNGSLHRVHTAAQVFFDFDKFHNNDYHDAMRPLSVRAEKLANRVLQVSLPFEFVATRHGGGQLFMAVRNIGHQYSDLEEEFDELSTPGQLASKQHVGMVYTTFSLEQLPREPAEIAERMEKLKTKTRHPSYKPQANRPHHGLGVTGLRIVTRTIVVPMSRKD